MLTRLVLLLCVALALPARAECTCATDPTCVPNDPEHPCDCVGPATCDATTFNGLAHGAESAEHTRDLCLATNDELAAKLLSAELQLQAIREDTPSVLPTLMLGAGVGAAFVAVLVLLAR